METKAIPLGAVAGANKKDEVLTCSATPTDACDWTSNYAKGHLFKPEDSPRAPYVSSKK